MNDNAPADLDYKSEYYKILELLKIETALKETLLKVLTKLKERAND